MDRAKRTDQGTRACAATAGSTRVNADSVIQTLLGLKQMFRLPLRALQGFAQSQRNLAFADLPVPNYTTLCCRAQTLQAQLPIIRNHASLHFVVDRTGAKLYGADERKVRQHSYSKRRTWHNVHLALDASTGQLRAALMTHQDVADNEVLPELLDQIPAEEPICTISADGAYDAHACHAAIAPRGAVPSIPSETARSIGHSTRPAGRSAMRQSMPSHRMCRLERKKRSGYPSRRPVCLSRPRHRECMRHEALFAVVRCARSPPLRTADGHQPPGAYLHIRRRYAGRQNYQVRVHWRAVEHAFDGGRPRCVVGFCLRTLPRARTLEPPR